MKYSKQDIFINFCKCAASIAPFIDGAYVTINDEEHFVLYNHNLILGFPRKEVPFLPHLKNKIVRLNLKRPESYLDLKDVYHQQRWLSKFTEFVQDYYTKLSYFFTNKVSLESDPTYIAAFSKTGDLQVKNSYRKILTKPWYSGTFVTYRPSKSYEFLSSILSVFQGSVPNYYISEGFSTGVLIDWECRGIKILVPRDVGVYSNDHVIAHTDVRLHQRLKCYWSESCEEVLPTLAQEYEFYPRCLHLAHENYEGLTKAHQNRCGSSCIGLLHPLRRYNKSKKFHLYWNAKPLPGKYYVKKGETYEICLPSKYLTTGTLEAKSSVPLELKLRAPVYYDGPTVDGTKPVFSNNELHFFLTLLVEGK